MKYRYGSSLGELCDKRNTAVVSLGALAHNYSLLRGKIAESSPRTRVIAVVKSDAYGHGTPACVRKLLALGCDFFAVSSLNEALAVRRACEDARADAEILILGYTDPIHASVLVRERLTQSLLSPDYADRLGREAAASGVTVRCHLAIDSGMNRIGFSVHECDFDQTVSEIERVRALDGLDITGIFTHFATASRAAVDADAEHRARLQLDRFNRLRSHLSECGGKPLFCHVCNSAASLLFPEYHLDGVRIGVALYGVNPADGVSLPLRPVMRLESEIAHLHTLRVGERVGYGASFGSDRERLIATLPIGYADGFLRAYKGAEVTVLSESGSHRAEVVGNVCMDQCMIDVTDTDARIGDRVILFGETADQINALAERAGSIPYESLCLVSARVMRIYEEENEGENR